MEHTAECELSRTVREAEQSAWDDNWPNGCHKCNAWGVEIEYENQAPIGSGRYWPEQITEECEYCVGEGKCPRCGSLLFEDAGAGYNKLWDDWFTNSKPCPVCGWNWGMNAGDIRPDDFECDCWMEDSYDEYKEELK